MVTCNYIKQLLKSLVLDQISAKSVRVSDKVTKSTSSISSSLLFLIFQEFDKELDTWSEMLIQDIIMETSITNSKASKFPCVSIRVLATGNSSLDESMFEQLLIEEASMSAEISNQVANFSSNTSILMKDQVV